MKCMIPNCDKIAVGKCWDTIRQDKPNAYCSEHLEQAQKLGYPIKFWSETDIICEEDFDVKDVKQAVRKP